MSTELNSNTLKNLGAEIQTPRYDRSSLGQAIVHIGVGGFHRAHQTIYTEDLFNINEAFEWGFCGIGLLPGDQKMRDVLQQQDYLYTLVERSADEEKVRIVGAIVNFIYAPDAIELAIAKMASPATKIVSLTITEGGYYMQDGSGMFNADHPDIQHDLVNPDTPRSSFGFLLAALDRRRKASIKPFTIMSCDNIQGNGSITKKMLLAFAELANPELAGWIADNASFPNSMVDRITPATTDELRDRLHDRFGILDRWPVTTEPFKQWVLEDKFTLGRPSWELTGVKMTTDVLPYEKMKIRLLNASHQALCYIGILLGYEFVHETMQDQDIRRLVQAMMDVEVTPILPKVPGVDLTSYKYQLLERFANPAIQDQLARIAIYGSTGLPKFVLPTIEEQLERGGSYHRLAFTVACWMRCLQGIDDRGRAITMMDPNAETLSAIALERAQQVDYFLSQCGLFPMQLITSPEFVGLVQRYLTMLHEKGARATLVAAALGNE